MLAGIAILLHAAHIADLGIVNNQVRGLVFLVLGAGVVEVGELVESELAIAFGVVQQVGVGAAVGGQLRQLLHARMSRSGSIPSVQAATAGELLQAGVNHAVPKS